jgi:hypothetical protein
MTVSVTASTVRDYFRADAKRMGRLSPEAQATVKEGARGRLHAQAIKEFNGKRKAHRRYVLGATTNEKARREAERNTLREAGLAGTRGPLSKAAKEFLAQPKG